MCLATAIGPALPYVGMNGMDDLRLGWKLPTNVFLAASQGQLHLLESRYAIPFTTDGRAGTEYVIENGIFVTRTYPIDWYPPNPPPGPFGIATLPSWSVHQPSHREEWDPGVYMLEIASGWPVRSIAVSRASADLGYSSLPPLGVAQSEMGFLSVTWSIRWWAMAINLAFFVTFGIVLRKGPWAAVWLRRYLRRRRGVCVVCAYPVCGFAQCSECGTSVDDRASTARTSSSNVGSIRRTRLYILACAAIGIGAVLTAATALARFATLLHRHSDHGWGIDDRVYAEDLRGGLESGRITPLLSKAPAPDGYRYFTARHVFASTVRGVAWDETHANPAGATPSRPPSWSLHQFDWTLDWPPETVLFEVAVGWPMRCVGAHRGEVRGSSPPTLVLHRGGSRSDYGRWGLRGFVWWAPMAINVACWAAIVVVLYGTVKAAVVLRSRRGRHRREA